MSCKDNSIPLCLQKKGMFYKSFPRTQILNKLRIMINNFSVRFFEALKNQLETELEVQVRNGILTSDAEENLDYLQTQFKILQYEEQVKSIFINCCSKFPHFVKKPLVFDLLCVAEDEVLGWFLLRIKTIYEKTLIARRRKNNIMCSQKCSVGPQVFNFTDTPISEELCSLFEKGLNNVPLLGTSAENLLKEFENEVLEACKNLFYSFNGYYPCQSSSVTLNHSILTIISQSGTNNELVNKLVSLRENFVNNVEMFLSRVRSNDPDYFLNLVPSNVIISPSDKQVGISILPFEWYQKEYRNQVIKGGYELVEMSEAECLAVLTKKIASFREKCSENQLRILSNYWPKFKCSVHRIGVLKLVPKVHKLTGYITSETWKILSSRPIRGAETCPMKTPSTALYRMLVETLTEFKSKFTSGNDFPVLKGCDDYINRLSKLKLDPVKSFKTTLLTADFGDAYTETSILHLQDSVSKIGQIIGFCTEKIELMKTLIDLVFSNSYFFTPFGLYRQTLGMPMGDVSSRDSLDLDLVNSEFQILSCISTISLDVHLYCRLVDDISVVSQGDFEGVRELIKLMASNYPKMPLNFQLSFGYSRFLDLHIYNICSTDSDSYQLVHSLAYKEHSTFS